MSQRINTGTLIIDELPSKQNLATDSTGAVVEGDGVTDVQLAAINHAAVEKISIVDEDEITGQDSASVFSLIRTTWSDVKVFLKTYFDTLYQDTLVSATNIKTINSTSLLGSGDIATSPLTTKGDIYGFSTLDDRLPVGTNGQVLTADSVQVLGVKWATPAGTGDMLVATYDPTAVNGDAFDMDNMAEGATAKILTAGERTILGNTSGTNSGDNAVNSNYSSLTQYTDELAQDAVGAMVDSSLTYTDATPELKVTNPVTAETVGFTISAGTTPKTLTVSDTASVTGTNTGDEVAASSTVAGVAELAIASEIDLGTDTTRTMPVDQFVASKRNIRWLVFNLVEAATDCAIATNIAGDFVSPIAGTILQSDTTPFYIFATNSTAGTTGTMVVDVSIGGTSIMTTNKLDFDTTEKTTTTAATPPDLTTTALAVGDIITIDIDSIHTTAAKGLTVYIGVRE